MEKIDNEKINDLIEENKKLKEDLLYEKHLYRELEILLNNKRELIKVLIKKAEKLQQENNQLKELQQQIIEKDKKIKVLEESREHFKSIAENIVTLLSKLNKELPNPQEKELNYEKCISDTILIIKEFKQSQNSKAIEVLERLKNDLFDYSVTINILEHRAIRLCNVRKVIDNQIAELRGDNHE